MHTPGTLDATIVALVRIWIFDELTGGGGAADPSLRATIAGPHHGVFVTVTVDGKLRGCIGCLDETLPLDAAIEHAARGAVSRDFRFDPIPGEDAFRIAGTVSLLGAMEPIGASDEIVIGVHGLYMEARGRRGLLLPQVASERQWSAVRFREAVCEKAGLPTAVLEDPSTLLCRFTAECIPFDMTTD
jgi:uncharacterized protein